MIAGYLARALCAVMCALPIGLICLAAAAYVRKREVDTMEKIFQRDRTFSESKPSGE